MSRAKKTTTAGVPIADLHRAAEASAARTAGADFGARYLARDLFEHGGRCDVAPETAARFVVRLVDGRTFIGCGVHGSGGAIHGRDALARAVLLLARGASLYLYTVLRWHGSHGFEVAAADVVSVSEVSDEDVSANDLLAAAGFTHRRAGHGNGYRHEILDAHGHVVALLTAHEVLPWLRAKQRCAATCVAIVRAVVERRRAAA